MGKSGEGRPDGAGDPFGVPSSDECCSGSFNGRGWIRGE